MVGGTGRGWSVLEGDTCLSDAIERAYSRARTRCTAQGEVHGGQTVRLSGLQARPELNGELGVAMRFVEAEGRWLVRLADGDGKKLKPANLIPLEGDKGRFPPPWIPSSQLLQGIKEQEH